MGIQICSNKGAVPFGAQYVGQNKENFDKSSKILPLTGMHCYLAWDILGTNILKFAQSHV